MVRSPLCELSFQSLGYLLLLLYINSWWMDLLVQIYLYRVLLLALLLCRFAAPRIWWCEHLLECPASLLLHPCSFHASFVVNHQLYILFSMIPPLRLLLEHSLDVLPLLEIAQSDWTARAAIVVHYLS